MPDDTPDTPKRSPSLTDQTVRFSELVAGYDEPTPHDVTCPIQRWELLDTRRSYNSCPEMVRDTDGDWVSYDDYRAAITADRARIQQELERYFSTAALAFRNACSAVDAAAREAGHG